MTENAIYQAPESDLTQNDKDNIFRKGKNVVYDQYETWPNRCYKCNASVDNWKKVTLTYLNPWFYLTFLLSPIILIILALIFQRKFKLDLPICTTHLAKRKKYVLGMWVGVALTFVSFILEAKFNNGIFLSLGIFLVIGLIVAAIAGRMVSVSKYKKDNIWVRGPGKPFLDSLPEFESKY